MELLSETKYLLDSLLNYLSRDFDSQPLLQEAVLRITPYREEDFYRNGRPKFNPLRRRLYDIIEDETLSYGTAPEALESALRGNSYLFFLLPYLERSQDIVVQKVDDYLESYKKRISPENTQLLYRIVSDLTHDFSNSPQGVIEALSQSVLPEGEKPLDQFLSQILVLLMQALPEKVEYQDIYKAIEENPYYPLRTLFRDQEVEEQPRVTSDELDDLTRWTYQN